MKSLLIYYNINNNYYRYKLVDSHLWRGKELNTINSYGEILTNIIELNNSKINPIKRSIRNLKNKHHKKLIIKFE